MGVNKFNVMSLGKARLLEPEQVGYKDSVDIIYDELNKTRKSFIKIGWYLKHIHDNKMYEQEGYANIYDLAMEKFRFSQPTTTRYINLCEEFSVNHNSPELDQKYEDYNISQLFEMLSMSKDKIEQVTPDMTVRQIRKIKDPSKKKNSATTEDNNITNTMVPGQTSIENDFPEYLPEQGYATSHNAQNIQQEKNCPENATSCMRQEWGFSEEEQNVGKKECEKCWDYHNATAATQNEAMSISKEQIIDGEYREICDTSEQNPYIDEQRAATHILEKEKQELSEYLSCDGIPEETIMRRRIIVKALEHYVDLLEDKR